MYPTTASEQFAKEQAYNQQRSMLSGQQTQASIGGLPQPKEPTLSDRLKELRQYLSELADVHGSTRHAVVGNESTEIQPYTGNNDKSAVEPSIEELAAECCQRAANLVGAARSLRNRL